jgi:hypothetical protein
MSPSKSRNCSLLAEERKQVISTKTRTLQGLTYPAYPSLRNTAEVPGEKKPHKTLIYRGIRD